MKKRLLLLASILAFGVNCTFSQTTDLGNPTSWNGKLSGDKTVPSVEMPSFDLEEVLIADSINNAQKSAPWRFGYEHLTDYTLLNSGLWETLPSGDRVWRLKIKSEDALSINLVFNHYFLSENAKLHLYSLENDFLLGAYTAENNNQNNELGTDLVKGDDIIVELYEPASEAGISNLYIGMVVHGYKDIYNWYPEKVNESGACNIDVVCPEGAPWGDQINAVARILNGGGLCTGTLMNNTANDGTPYFLTANHCNPQNMGAGVFKFNYESTVCSATNNSTDPGTNDVINGSIFRARNPASDVGLIELNSVPPASYGVYYAGWDNSGNTPTNTIGIHHPAGDVKKISFDNDAPTITSYSSGVVPGDGSMWRIITWDQNSTTEGGSSGSALFDNTGKVIGQLYGGGAACGNTQSDWYGRLSVSWEGPTAAERLKDWLDPTNINTPLEGYDPNAPTTANDAQLLNITAPTGNLCGTGTFIPSLTLRNAGTANLTSVTITYDVDGGGTQTFNWTGDLATSATEVVTLPSVTSTNGAHTFNASLSNPNGVTDENLANNTSSSAFTANLTGETVTVIVNTDCWGSETSWRILDGLGTVMETAGPFADAGNTATSYQQQVCLTPDCYTFEINDSYGDGMAGNGVSGCTLNGAYYITQFGYLNDSIQNVAFGSQELNTFCVKSLLANFSASTNTVCEGGNITFTQAVVEGPATGYEWSFPGADVTTGTNASETVTYSTAGSYDVQLIVTDGVSYDTLLVSNLVTVNAPATTTGVITDATCNGTATGAVTSTTTGGLAPYTYAWNNGAGNNANASNLAANTYTLTVTDANSCASSADYVVGEPDAITITSTDVNPTCNGASTGSIGINAMGGDGSYTYTWAQAGVTGQNPSSLAAGTYNVTVTDGNGCSNTYATTLTEPTLLTSSINGTTNVTCNNGSDGAIDLTVTGGTAPYGYAWTNGASATQDPSGLSAGTYAVTITDANGCTANNTATLTEPTAIIANTSTTDATCGNANGSVSVAPTGGNAPYTYMWSTSATTTTVNNLSANTYTVVVTDANGCTANGTAVVNNIAAPTATVNVIANATCNGQSNGSAQVAATGAGTPFTYAWSTGGTSTIESGIAAGTHSVVITDNNGCTTTENFTITEPTAITGTVSSSDATCGVNNGSASVTAAGGNGAYTYAWSSGGTNATESGLGAGSYTVTITDGSGCTGTATANVSSSGGATISITSSTNVDCFGNSNGTANASISGGVTPYTTSWSTGGTTVNETGMPAGTHSISVTDNAGCISTSSVTITEPTALNATVSTTSASCGNANGTATVNATGGTAPYTYSWSNGPTTVTNSGLSAGAISVTITDANGCTTSANGTVDNNSAATLSLSNSTQVTCNGTANGSATIAATGGATPYIYSWTSGGNGATETGLAAGTHTATVTDNNGCSTSLDVVITEPTAISITNAVTNVDCNSSATGSITSTVTGGTGNYTYSWSSGETVQNISNVTAGSYTLTVTDENGCTASSMSTVTEPTALALTETSVVNVDCNANSTGEIVTSLVGGTPDYTYLWSDNGGTNSTASSLSAGTYTLTATDANGCVTTLTSTVTEPQVLTASVSTTMATCGNSDGTASATVNGGTLPYTYNWTDLGTADTENNLAPGTYEVTITDANGCTVVENGEVLDAGGITVSTSSTDASCFEGNNGTAEATVNGGDMPYTYSWTSGGTAANETGLGAGTYTVTVTDNNGCTANADVTIGEGTEITLTSSIDHVMVGGDGAIDLTVAGGVAPYSYSWDNASATEDLSNLDAGTFTVTVTDANGCTATQSFTVDSHVGVDTEANVLAVNIYPNPTAGIVYANLNMMDVNVSVTNSLGQDVMSLTSDSNETLILDLSRFESGIYFVNFETSTGFKVVKRIIVKP